jgi:hypothetical protein
VSLPERVLATSILVSKTDGSWQAVVGWEFDFGEGS